MNHLNLSYHQQNQPLRICESLNRPSKMFLKNFTPLLKVRALAIIALLSQLLIQSARSAEWQWSVPVASMTSGETNDHPRAFLWIPPGCQRLRAVIVGQHNMEEEPLLDHPKIRAACRELGFAQIWITPSIDLSFNAAKDVGEHFEAMFKALALESGYSELATVPVLPIGHSASSGFPWRFADWKPERTLAALSTSGSWPVRPTDVPGLVTLGEYEGAGRKISEGLSSRPGRPLSAIGENGGGHFDASDRKLEYIALYLKKLAQYRLNPDGTLHTLDATKTGWLVDQYRFNELPKAPAAPVGKYTGDPNQAFWFFDEELARATEEFQAYQRGKKVQLLGYIQDGKVVEQNPNLHGQVPLRFLPDEDGVTFKLIGTFIDTVPPGRPEWWTGLPKGSPIEHGSDKITIERICGPVAQVGPDTWAISFYRMGMNNRSRSKEIWFAATQPGDDVYRRSVQQAVMQIPYRHDTGQPQSIAFPEMKPDLKLSATSDSGLPVYYYVREGPAEIEGDHLKLTPIPPRSRHPIRITVIAWQYGNGKFKTAEPVERNFTIGTGLAVDVAPIFAKASDTIRAKAEAAIQAAAAAPNTISFHICKSVEMKPGDLAGADARVGNWNNIKGLTRDTTVTLDQIIDKSGKAVPGVTLKITGGNSASGAFDHEPGVNDDQLFSGIYDQFDGAPTRIELSGIPYARYDVYFYRRDGGPQRAGKFTIGNQEIVAPGGAGQPNADGTGYVRGKNYVRFENLTGPTLTATFTTEFAGDKVQRNQVAGFQVVERK
jgi:hypothetical protein